MATFADGFFVSLAFNASTGGLAMQASGVLTPALAGNSTVLSADPLCTAAACYALVLSTAPAANSPPGTAVTVMALASPQKALASAAVQTALAVDAGGSVSAALSSVAGTTSAFEGLAVYAASAQPPALGRNLTAPQPGSADAWTLRRLAEAAGLCPPDDGACDAAAAFGAASGDGVRSYVYAAYVSAQVTDGGGNAPTATLAVERYAAGGSDAAPPVRMGFGTAPHVYVTNFNGTLLALETNTDGTCQCGLLYNNADFSRCFQASPAADDQFLYALFQTVPYLLNYNYGTLAAFRAAVNAPYAPFSLCNPTIMSGKFENGYSVSASLFAQTVVYTNDTGPGAPAGPHTEVALLALHDGDVLCPLLTTAFCGSPLPKPGPVFDQFRLPQPWQLPPAQ
jgi:hypothetical protein